MARSPEVHFGADSHNLLHRCVDFVKDGMDYFLVFVAK
jgi:hypothetical protein